MILLILIIFICNIIGFFVFNFLFLKTNYNKNFFENIEKFNNGVPDNLEMVCFGSSYAKYDIDFSLQDKNAFNFGIAPQSLHYALNTMKQYVTKFSPGCNVLIVISPLFFLFQEYEDDVSNYIYYKFMNKKLIYNYSLRTKISHVLLPLIATPRLVKYIKEDVPLSNVYLNSYIDKNHTKYEGQIRKNGWCNQFGICNLKSLEYIEQFGNVFVETKKYLSEMIELCIEGGYKPVIVIPPVSGLLYNYFSKEFLEECLYKNVRIANVNKIPVFNYLEEEEFWEFTYYSNSDFMNQAGRKKFSKRLFRDIEKRENDLY